MPRTCLAHTHTHTPFPASCSHTCVTPGTSSLGGSLGESLPRPTTQPAGIRRSSTGGFLADHSLSLADTWVPRGRFRHRRPLVSLFRLNVSRSCHVLDLFPHSTSFRLPGQNFPSLSHFTCPVRVITQLFVARDSRPAYLLFLAPSFFFFVAQLFASENGATLTSVPES